jgi:lipopolysaccharide/colanic/teichoic acid biosynthesis glycosyltransferase
MDHVPPTPMLSSVSMAVEREEVVDRCLVTPRKVRYAFAKRTFDVVMAVFLIVLLSPFFVLIALIVRFTSKGPILYKSERIGLGGKAFKFVKFRSMTVDADHRLADMMIQNEKDGPIFKMKQDPRVTPIGKKLRQYSLDELPQLFNVLKGEMSIVGPRPPIRREVELYSDHTLQRLSVKPGITCYWQIKGRSNLTFDRWMELDHQYLSEMSFWVDLVIFAKTPLAILRAEGAY